MAECRVACLGHIPSSPLSVPAPRKLRPSPVFHHPWGIGQQSHCPVVLAGFLSGYSGEYSSQWAHFLGQKITYIHFREKKRERNTITEPGSQRPEGILVAVSLPVVGVHRQELWGSPRCRRGEAGLRQLIHYQCSYVLDATFVFPFNTRSGLSCLMATNLRRAGGRARKERIVDLLQLHSILSTPCR